MSAARTHVAAYRCLTALYPRRFRDEYRGDLIVLFRQQLEDDGPGRVWLRTARDMAVTVPVQHLEAHVQRSPHAIITALSSVVALAATFLALALGTRLSLALLFVAAGAGTVAIWSRRAGRPLAASAVPWWKYVVGSLALLVVTFSAMAVPWPDALDLGDNAYWLVVGSVMTALALGALGFVVGVGTLIRRRRTPRPA